MVKLLIGFLRLYQLTISPRLGARCRFVPSCSTYLIDALRERGLPGLALGAKRLARCRPWGGSGFDPVPAPHPTEH